MALSLGSDFVSLGPRISLHTPTKPAKGQLIIICIWLGAAPKHIAKYIAVYQGIASRARILLIQSNVPVLVSSYARQRAAIVPAVTTVLETLAECSYPSLLDENDDLKGDGNAIPRDRNSLHRKSSANQNPRPKILLHMFSNGGINTATQFLFVLNERLHAPFPLYGMLYDSCPAKGTYWKDHRAMVYSLPKNIFSRTLGNIVVHIILLMLHTEIACGLENPSSLFRRILLDEEKVSGGAMTVPRKGGDGLGNTDTTGGGTWKRSAYLYSKSDPMVDWTDIRDHAAEARSKGWDVEEILFDDSGHCGHFQKDQETYVDAMKRMWLNDSHPENQPQTSDVRSKL